MSIRPISSIAINNVVGLILPLSSAITIPSAAAAKAHQSQSAGTKFLAKFASKICDFWVSLMAVVNSCMMPAVNPCMVNNNALRVIAPSATYNPVCHRFFLFSSNDAR